MKKLNLTNLLLLFILLSCTKNIGQNNQSSRNAPASSDVIPFEYDEKMLKMIIMSGLLNDSIPLSVLFDTGWTDDITISDSLKEKTKDNTHGKLQIGKTSFSQTLRYISRNNMFFKILGFSGRNGAATNWRIFEGKIIEISYKEKCIRELNNIDDLIGYDSIKIKRDIDRYLVIPVNIHVRGKEIKEDLMIDTGCNDEVLLKEEMIDKYAIDTVGAYYGAARMVDGLHRGFSIKGDSIGVGKYFVPSSRSISFKSIDKRKLPFGGLLGNAFLEKFSIILDLKNYTLYFKPIEKHE